MQKTAQEYPRIYAVAEKGVNAAYVRVAFWAVGSGDFNASFRVSFARAEIPAKIAEIDAALAEGSGVLDAGDGQIYEISDALLGELRSILSSYAVSGGSGAQAVRAGVSMPSKPKALARAERSAARQFKEEPGRDSGIAKQSRKGQSPFNGSGTAAAHTARASANFEAQVARIVGEELRRAVMPLLAEIDAIAALLKETAAEAGAFKPVEMDASDMPISTRCGRTSVVVGRRKIS